MNESWTLGISRRYRLEELIGLDQIKQYLSRVSVPCSILDVDGRWVGEPPAHHDLCRLITESVDGRGACAGCLGKRMQAADSIDGPLVHECLVGLYSCIAAVRVVDEVVGYVAGPIFLREPLTSIQVATLRDVEKENSLDELLPPSQEDSVTEAVLKLSRQIGRRCASERGLRLLNEGTRRLAGVMSTIEAQGTLIETADAFFNRATVAVYQPTSDGVLQLCRVQPARATWQVENRIRFGEGPVGLAAATRQTQWISDPSRGAPRSILAIPMLAGEDRLMGVLDVRGEYVNAFSHTDVQANEILASVTAMALQRSELSYAARIGAIVATQDSNWTNKIVELMVRRIETGADRNKARRELYHLLADSARERVGAVRASVRDHHSLSGDLAVAVTSGEGWTPELRAKVHRRGDDTAGSYAVMLKTKVVINDVDNAPSYYKKVFPDAKSNLGVPILLRGEVVALLTLQSRERNFFTAERCRVVESMVAQAIEVIERLVDIQERWLSDLERSLRQAEDADSTCRAAVSHIRKILSVHGCSFFLWNASSERLEFASSTRPWYPLQGERPSYQLGDGLTGWVAQKRMILRLDDIRDEDELARVAKDLKWRPREWGEVDHWTVDEKFGYLGAPLIFGEKLLGVVRVTLKENASDVFDASDEILIDGVARLLARKIEEVSAAGESAKRIEELGSLVRLDSSLASTLDIQAVCAIVLEQVRDITGCAAAHIRFLELAPNSQDQVLRVAASFASYEVPPVVSFGENISGYVAKTRDPLFASDVKTHERWSNTVAGVVGKGGPFPWVASGACLPLVVGDELVGTLLLEWSTEKKFENAHQKHLRDLADRCAAAVKAALTYRDKVTSITDIRAAGLRFTQILTLEKLMSEVLDEVLHVAEIGSGLIRLLDDSKTKWVLYAAKAKKADEQSYLQLLEKELDVTSDFLGQALESPVPRRIHVEDEAFREFRSRLAGTQAQYVDTIKWLLILPLWVHDRCIGFLSLTSTAQPRLDDSKIEFLVILATFAAVAIENARMLKEERSRLPLAIMGSMLGGFLHRIRTPLAVLLNKLDNIEHPLTSPSEVQTRIGELRPVVLEIREVCIRLARFSRPVQLSSMERFDLGVMLKRVNTEFAGSAKERGIEISLDGASSDTVIMRGNEEQLEEVARLVLLNALEHTRAGGSVGVRIENADGKTMLRFSDTGSGMDEETRTNWMDIDFIAKKGNRQGRGLGLAVVSVLVRYNGGEIRIDSRKGAGTIMSISFPIEEVSDAESAGRR